jgi:hypothetical protein
LPREAHDVSAAAPEMTECGQFRPAGCLIGAGEWFRGLVYDFDALRPATGSMVWG